MSHCKCTFCNLQLLNWAHRQRNTGMLLVSAIHCTDSSFLYRKPASKDHLSISCIGLPCTPAIRPKELSWELKSEGAKFFSIFPWLPCRERFVTSRDRWQSQRIGNGCLSANTLASLCSLQQESHAKRLCAGCKPWICRKHIFENGLLHACNSGF
jgi:hypothetical protein